MSDGIVMALIRKASVRADELQSRGNNHVAISKLLRDEGFDAAAEQVERLGEMYKRMAADVRTCIKGMSVDPRAGEPS